MDQKEKRRFERMQFSGSNGIAGIFVSETHPDQSLTASIMDLSLGGMGIVFKKDISGLLHQGDVLILSEIRNMTSLAFMKNIKMKIRWTVRQPPEQFAAGCEFVEISKDFAETLQKVMDSWKIRII
ncbi:MAG: PilZ domain-containing protein [Desulfococcaceae bacterium]